MISTVILNFVTNFSKFQETTMSTYTTAHKIGTKLHTFQLLLIVFFTHLPTKPSPYWDQCCNNSQIQHVIKKPFSSNYEIIVFLYQSEVYLGMIRWHNKHIVAGEWLSIMPCHMGSWHDQRPFCKLTSGSYHNIVSYKTWTRMCLWNTLFSMGCLSPQIDITVQCNVRTSVQ